MTSFLPVKLPCIILCNPSGRIWLPPITSYWGSPPLPPSVLPTRAPLVEEQPPMATPPTPMPKWSPWPKRQLPLPELQGSTSIDGTAPKATQEGPSSPKRQEAPAWFTSLKPSHAEAFLQDSSIIKEARLHFFSNHSYDFVHDGTPDLSDVFKELAKSASLLGEAIYKIQLSWTRPEELKQANYTLQSLPKRLRFPQGWCPPWSLPRSWGLWASMIWMPFDTMQATPTVPGAGRRGRMRGQWLTI